ncbi:MAG: extracellular solute-binding protein [Clostridia bacterium]|nr:extracellular solute-binding protein [Clostridia bacterium]
MDYANIRKTISFFLAVIMAVGVMAVPFSVSADEGSDSTEMTAETALGTTDPAEAVEEATLEDVSLLTTPTEVAVQDDSQYTATYDEETLKKMLGAPSYNEYTELHGNAPRPDRLITITPDDLLKEQCTSEVKIIKAEDIMTTNFYTGEKTVATGVYEDAPTGDAVYSSASGNTVFKVNIPETGNYSMRITYTTDTSLLAQEQDDISSEIPTTIERMIYIDDELPFTEARYLYFPRVWEYEYQTDDDGNFITADVDTLDGYNGRVLTFPKDKNGNDTRPRRWEVVKWQTYYVRDWLGYEMDPLQFYFTEGEHTVTLVSNREAMVISKIELYKYEEEKPYEEWLKDMKASGVKEIKDATPVKIQFENPKYISVQNIIPSNDRTSSLSEPQDPAVIKYNYLDNGTVNNWMLYDVEVPETGLYSISFRFRQNSLIGMFTSRRMRVNGEVQYREASFLRFKFNTAFQTSYATDGEQEFLIYLEKGVNQIQFEVVVGQMCEFIYDIEQMIDKLNDAYQTMLMITGPVPDTYRDYGFGRLCPEAIDTIAQAADLLYEIKDKINEMTGETSDNANALESYADLFKEMATNEYEIAPNFISFKNFIISLSDWLYSVLAQPVKLDYFIVGDVNEELPDPIPSSFQRMGFEIKAFFASFSMDYTTIGFRDDAATAYTDVIEMWAVADRETMLIQRYIVDNYFTPQEKISLRIKVITAGLQEAILAGIGPDVSFLDTTNTITFGMRTALMPLEGYDGFDELMKEYPEAMTQKLTMVGKAAGDTEFKEHAYGIPTTLVFPMAFFRIDVLEELGIKIPDSWDELYDNMQTLGNKNLEVGVPTGLVGTELFLYQLEGGDIWSEDGYSTGLDTNVALSAFQSICEMFTKYSSPYAYDITRFRTGEVPIMVIDDSIAVYNQLMTFYELRGLWKMTPVIGTKNEDGTINRTAVANTQAMIMPRGNSEGGHDEIVWRFMRWYCGTDSQTRQARETIAVGQPTSKYSTANIEALLAQKWTEEERTAVRSAVNNLVATKEYPGAYIIPTYLQFAFQDAVNNGSDPSSALLDQILDINKEITRKRKEFGLDAHEISYGNDSSDDTESADGADNK